MNRATLITSAFLLLVTGMLMAGTPTAGEAQAPEGKPRAKPPLRDIDEPKGAGIVSSGVTLPAAPGVTGSRKNPVPSWGKPLPYPIVIADRRNNRLLEVTPDKRIVWEFPSPNLAIYSGNEDVNFSEDGKRLAVSEEDNYDVHIVDYEKRELTWTYGVPDKAGHEHPYLNYPDDAHLLADGKFLTADIRNCRVLIIDPSNNEITTQWGKPGDRRNCRHEPPNYFAFPNGATPLANGDILVSEIRGAWLTRVTRAGKVVWSVQAPNIRYPSDAFPTVDGENVIVADFWKPGRVVIFDPRTRKVLWQYDGREGDKLLDHPSLARELPHTHDILVADDLRHRVVVIDRKTKEIIWQYGVTDQKGHQPGYLFYPDGFDLDVFRDWRPAAKKP